MAIADRLVWIVLENPQIESPDFACREPVERSKGCPLTVQNLTQNRVVKQEGAGKSSERESGREGEWGKPVRYGDTHRRASLAQGRRTHSVGEWELGSMGV